MKFRLGAITLAVLLAGSIGLSTIRLAAGTQPQALTYPIVDTGQNACYDDYTAITCPAEGRAFYGQDAQLAGNPPSYTLSADGLTVYDNVTGLTWTQSPDLNGDGEIDAGDKLAFAQAQTYLDALNARTFGGYSDWRVPTIKELYSLIDFRGMDPPPEGGSSAGLTPFIDTDYFAFAYGDTGAGERIIDAQFLSSTAYVGTVMGGRNALFGVNFADGRIKGYPSDKAQFVYWVRGNPSYGENSFANNGDGTVTDGATGLIWSQADSGGSGMNWEEALAWVQARNDERYLGYDDWRLPNAKELQSIVDYSRSPDTSGTAAIAPVFDVTQITNEAGQTDSPFYWSSTSHLRANGTASAAVYVAFGRGLGSMGGLTVIDVHGAGCQRSDPKDGSRDAYPRWGFGPQGDVQRVFNHVRLVRDAGDITSTTTPTPTSSATVTPTPKATATRALQDHRIYVPIAARSQAVSPQQRIGTREGNPADTALPGQQPGPRRPPGSQPLIRKP